MNTSSHKPKSKQAEAKPEKHSKLLWQGLPQLSSDEEEIALELPEASRTPSKSQNPGILPHSSSLHSSDFLESDVFDYDSLQRTNGIGANEGDELELWVMRVPQGVRLAIRHGMRIWI